MRFRHGVAILMLMGVFAAPAQADTHPPQWTGRHVSAEDSRIEVAMRSLITTAAMLAWLCSDTRGFVPFQSPTCDVTVANHSIPPDGVLAKAAYPRPSPAELIHGNGGLWTVLWPDGNVVVTNGGVGAILPDGSLRMKFLWLLAGDGPLTVVGRRLDGSSRPLKTTIPEGFIGKGFQPSHLIFQSAGCWEITATANGSVMSFVTKVTRGQ